MQIILFTNKPETPGIFRALAANLRNTTFQFADVSSESVGILEQFGIKKVSSWTLWTQCHHSQTFPWYSQLGISLIMHETHHLLKFWTGAVVLEFP